MKRIINLLISLLIVNYSSLSGNASVTGINSVPYDSIRVFCSPDLYSISTKWATEYNKLNSGTKISVRSVSEPRMVNDLVKNGQIGFITNDIATGLGGESLSKLVVGRDIIVPVINSKNPFLDEINQKGISPGNLLLSLNSPNSKKWGTLLGGTQIAAANFYFIDDASITKSISDFLRSSEIRFDGIKTENSIELLSAIQKDPYAIGFCKMINVIDLQKQALTEGISLMPIDRNGNGIMDYNEKIFDDFADLSRGVWIGKYPKTLFSNIYSVSSLMPGSKPETAFLTWVVNDGQQFLYSNGYSDLLMSERTTTTDKLYEAQIYSGSVMNDKSVLRTILFYVIALVLVGLAIDFAVRYFKPVKSILTVTPSLPQPVLDTNGLHVPGGLFFDKTHTWAFMEQNGFVKVGIDDFIQHITGTITRVKMKNEGFKVKKGDLILSVIQNGKQLNLYSPVSGTIREKNSILDSNASIVNTSPYNDGWVYRIEPSNWHRENQLLFMAERHKEFIKNEFSRLKDFLVVVLGADEKIYAQTILQDGGELVDNTLSNLGPEVWEEFQSKFIDPSRQVWFHELF
jgi:glycine cleavage system H lipoate-binding protein/ABC-type phosphate transport system substrate-binding protein